MKKLILILMVGSLLAQDSPCEDETYLELKEKKLDEMSDREYEYFTRKDQECSAYLSKTPKSKSNVENYSDISDKTWSVAGGLGTNRSLTLIGISKDIKIGENASFFLTTGIGTALIGAGFAYQSNYNKNGVNLSATCGYQNLNGYNFLSGNMSANYQWRIGKQSFLSAGLMGGFFFYKEEVCDYGYCEDDTFTQPYIFPTISYDFRF